MATTDTSEEDLPPSPAEYAPGTGTDRYVRFAEDWLDLQLGDIQRRLLEALESHRRVIATGGNGVGKSYGGGGAGSLAALFCNRNCTVNITSGSYGQLDDTIWKPIKSLHRKSHLPGRSLDNKRELKSGIEEGWYLKCLSPRYPADLEGRHNARMVYIIEEADKPGITHEHIDSAESTLTDTDDRLLVIANPPEDESNVVYDLMHSEKWHHIQFSSFECHNVQVDIGARDEPKIPGLVELSEIRENWEDWNAEPWPGHEEAFTAHEHRDDLDSRWYRRRAGIIPAASASVHRPFTRSDVEAAFEREASASDTPDGLALDVARMGGDSNALAGLFGGRLDVLNVWTGTDHMENKARVQKCLGDGWEADFAIDAQGEGSGLADEVGSFYPHTRRFNAGGTAVADTEYYDCWAEGLDLLGDFLQNGGSFSNRRLREELLAAARTVEFDEQYYKTRDATVLKATSKSDVKDHLGHSPDILDAAYMAVWAARAAGSTTVRRKRGSRPARGNVSR